MQNFLRREVKKDGKGLYVHYGPTRFRPNPRVITNFRKGETVSFDLDWTFKFAKVFTNIHAYETWYNYGKVNNWRNK